MALSLIQLFVPLRAAGVLFALLLASLGAQAQRIVFEGIGDPGASYSRAWVDVNNDGKDDFCVFADFDGRRLDCYLSKGDGFQSPAVSYIVDGFPQRYFQWVDVNGDGQVDLCRLMDRVGDKSTASMNCRLGPNFVTQVGVSIPVAYTKTCFPPDEVDCGVQLAEGLLDESYVFFADVDLDGRSDICYISSDFGGVFTLRCMLSTGAGFSAVTSNWTRAITNLGEPLWPRGFFDVNGDGYPDFCRISGSIWCLLGSASGFATTATMDSPSLTAVTNYKEGAAFIDINGDGKTDFCRFTGNPGTYNMSCRLSNGKSWQASDVSVAMSDTEVGQPKARWWADVNGDGKPDFCRAVGPDPDINVNMSNLWCRLARGGDATTGLFSPRDIKLDDSAAGAVDFGASDGGRAFCDPFGNGIPTLCRATFRSAPGGQECYLTGNGLECHEGVINTYGISVGVYGGLNVTSTFKEEIQAGPPLLMSYTDGLGAETRVTYMPMSSSQVYARSGVGSGFPRVQIVQPRSPVVFETRAWQTGATVTPVTLTGNARYFYKDLRVDNQTGSRGFRERWFLSEGANSIEHAIYYQGLGPTVDTSSIDASSTDPVQARRGLLEIGQPKEKRVYAIDPVQIPTTISGWTPPAGAIDRQLKLAATMRQATALASAMTTTPVSPPTQASPFMLLKRTTSTLGDSVPASARFRPVVSTHTDAWDWNDRTAVPLPIVDGSSVTTDRGNVTGLVETTTHGGQIWKKTTTNIYGADNPTTWILGRLTKASVVSEAPTVATQLAANATAYGTSPNANTVSSASPIVVGLTAPSIPNTQVGQTATATATLTNNAGYPVVIVPPTASSVTGTDLSFVSTTCGVQLATSATCTVTVRFAPTSANTMSGTVAIETASGPRVAAFTATSLANFSTATLTSVAPNLGSVWFGAAAPTATATFRNDGNSAMTLTGLSGLSTRFQLTANTCTGIAAAATCSMTLSMPTSVAGSAPSTVTTAGATNNASFTITGTVNSAVSRWSVTTLAFGNVTTGQSSTQSLTLFNDGFGSPINWNAALVNLPTGFTANTSACASVSPAASCSVSITFSPTAGQAYSGSAIRPSPVSYTGNTLAVSGTGVLPAATVSVSPTSVSFGTSLLKGSYVIKTVTITNSGTVAATSIGYAITSGGGFPGYSVANGTCPAVGGTLAAGASCTVSVTFEASCAGGSFNGTLSVSSANLPIPKTVALSASVRSTGICSI
jgi:FG-GAP-like repeat/Abnormal spindle-like microcephaly-assoc'd, ASPM-SPD-2-Hydin